MGDLIKTFKILKSYERLDEDYFFEIAHNRDKLRGHELKFYKKWWLNVRQNLFSQWVVDEWNLLPGEVKIHYQTVNEF